MENQIFGELNLSALSVETEFITKNKCFFNVLDDVKKISYERRDHGDSIYYDLCWVNRDEDGENCIPAPVFLEIIGVNPDEQMNCHQIIKFLLYKGVRVTFEVPDWEDEQEVLQGLDCLAQKVTLSSTSLEVRRSEGRDRLRMSIRDEKDFYIRLIGLSEKEAEVAMMPVEQVSANDVKVHCEAFMKVAQSSFFFHEETGIIFDLLKCCGDEGELIECLRTKRRILYEMGKNENDEFFISPNKIISISYFCRIIGKEEWGREEVLELLSSISSEVSVVGLTDIIINSGYNHCPVSLPWPMAMLNGNSRTLVGSRRVFFTDSKHYEEDEKMLWNNTQFAKMCMMYTDLAQDRKKAYEAYKSFHNISKEDEKEICSCEQIKKTHFLVQKLLIKNNLWGKRGKELKIVKGITIKTLNSGNVVSIDVKGIFSSTFNYDPPMSMSNKDKSAVGRLNLTLAYWRKSLPRVSSSEIPRGIIFD